MQLKLGTWVAWERSYAPSTIEWAGGLVNFSHVLFQVLVESVNIRDGAHGIANATWYEYSDRYSDRSGSYKSIIVKTSDQVPASNTTGLTPSSSSSDSPSFSN